MRFALIVALLSLATACRHPLEISGQGDIYSTTRAHDCILEEQPCENLVTGDYIETYTAVPRPGWQFVGWERCGDQHPQCSINVAAETVARFESRTMPSLRAVFEPIGVAKPNILTIMADDLGFNDLAINNGNTEIHTPNMDQIAREGVRFTRHYGSTVCSPARAAFLTGLEPERLGYIPNGAGISPQLITLPERLRQEGYTTWHIGKWHIGELYRDAWPDRQGFDHWFGFLNQWLLAGHHVDHRLGFLSHYLPSAVQVDHWSGFLKRWLPSGVDVDHWLGVLKRWLPSGVHVGGELKFDRPRYEDPWLEGDGLPGQHYPGHLENILTDKAIEVLSELDRAGGPWYMNLWYYAPHGPITPAKEFAERYPDTDDGRYRALVNQLDHNIGRVIAHLEELGALENTIVVIVSDNGGAAKRLDNNDNNAPFRGFKADLHEGALRTPLIVRWPHQALAGKVYTQPVSIRDIFPTLLQSINVAPQAGIDGVGLLPVIQGFTPPLQRTLAWEQNANSTNYALLAADSRWKLVKLWPFLGESDPMLFDMEDDPTGWREINPPPEGKVEELFDTYVDWFKDVHVVATDYTPDGNGGGTLTGLDFLRTPGFGYYTFGVGIAHDFQGSIAKQEGIWALKRINNTVSATFGGLTLSGEIASGNACHSIVVSGLFDRYLSGISRPDTTSLTLYIDGERMQSSTMRSAIPSGDLSSPILMGDSSIEGNGEIWPPVILNRSFVKDSVWTIGDFSEELCAGG